MFVVYTAKPAVFCYGSPSRLRQTPWGKYYCCGIRPLRSERLLNNNSEVLLNLETTYKQRILIKTFEGFLVILAKMPSKFRR